MEAEAAAQVVAVPADVAVAGAEVRDPPQERPVPAQNPQAKAKRTAAKAPLIMIGPVDAEEALVPAGVEAEEPLTGGAGSSSDGVEVPDPKIPLQDSLRKQLLQAPNVADEIEILRKERAAKRKEMNDASKKLRQECLFCFFNNPVRDTNIIVSMQHLSPMCFVPHICSTCNHRTHLCACFGRSAANARA